MVLITQRAADIRPFIVMDVLEAAQAMERNGEDVIHLEVGEPDFDTPECIKMAGFRALHEGKTHYTHSLGLLELREAICDHYRQRYGVTVSPEQVIELVAIFRTFRTGGAGGPMLAVHFMSSLITPIKKLYKSVIWEWRARR